MSHPVSRFGKRHGHREFPAATVGLRIPWQTGDSGLVTATGLSALSPPYDHSRLSSSTPTGISGRVRLSGDFAANGRPDHGG
jgi:hypothetical protein